MPRLRAANLLPFRFDRAPWRTWAGLALALLLAGPPLPAQRPVRVFNVREFGAKGDGLTLDSPAIDRALAAAAAAGGGTVEVPAGTYVCYSIHLQSHVALYLDQGATILALEPSADLRSGYDAPEPNPGIDQYQDFGHSHWHNSLIWGENLDDLAILGPGRIFGRGLSRGFDGRRDLLPEERDLPEARRPDLAFPKLVQEALLAVPPGPFDFPGDDALPAGVGNKAIALKNCRNVLFRDFTVYHGGHFAILATGVDNWTCDNLKIDTNRDGIDLDCCRSVRIANCTVNSPYDDGICPKSSYALGRPRPTEGITIANCQVSGFQEGSVLDGTRRRFPPGPQGPTGRIKCGTESTGGFRDITISNCVFEYSCGLALESVDGAPMEDITVTGLAMREIVNAPIFIRLGARLRAPAGTKVGTARRIRISDVVAHDVAGTGGILLAGLAYAPLEDIAISHVFLECAGGGTPAQALRRVPEHERAYPDPGNFGILPAWGLWARHVRNLQLDHVEVRRVAGDQRPAATLEDVAGAALDHVTLQRMPELPALVVKKVTGLDLNRCPGLPERTPKDPAADGSF